MNAKLIFLRFVILFALLLGAVGVPTSTVLADQPFTYEFSYSDTATITDVCPFPFTFHSEFHAVWTDFYVQGKLTMSSVHVKQQDILSKDAVTLVGLPYTYKVDFFYDSEGNMTGNYGVAVVEKVPLPDGTLFISAGRINWLDHIGTVTLFSPDNGNPGKIDALCAALAP